MDKYTGKVKYLNKEHGFGYISLCEDPGREHGDINFSTSDPGCHSLSLGDIVTLDIRKGNSINKNGKICEYAVSVQLNESISRPMTSYYQHKTDKESMQGNRELKQAMQFPAKLAPPASFTSTTQKCLSDSTETQLTHGSSDILTVQFIRKIN